MQLFAMQNLNTTFAKSQQLILQNFNNFKRDISPCVCAFFQRKKTVKFEPSSLFFFIHSLPHCSFKINFLNKCAQLCDDT